MTRTQLAVSRILTGFEPFHPADPPVAGPDARKFPRSHLQFGSGSPESDLKYQVAHN